MTARGIRNKNPGNIRHGSDKWQGMSVEQNDSAFVTFDEMTYGCRALIKTLQTYADKYGLNTVQGIIHRWAPTNENDTESYINSVAKALDVTPNESLVFNERTYIALAKAIAKHENGSDASLIDDRIWEKAYELA